MSKEHLAEIQSLLFEFMSNYHQKFVSVFRQDIGGFRCTKNQKMALFFIKKKESVIATELGKVLDMRKGSLTTLVDSLEKMDFVQREADPGDRRKALLTLTPKGEDYYKQMMDRFEENFRERFQRAGGEEVEEFHRCMGVIVKTIKKL